ncbi:MAG: DUF3796 domain-containing protein [Clostridia bacterium]|nr:DUF3796 domain-containing protein [Clostridia bacterium]
MKRNWIKYLGFLGLLGLPSIFAGNLSFTGFFGFFGFFSFYKIHNDERFSANINKAAKNTLLITFFLYPATTIYANLIADFSIFVHAYAINFALQIIVFAFSLQYYDKVGE